MTQRKISMVTIYLFAVACVAMDPIKFVQGEACFAEIDKSVYCPATVGLKTYDGLVTYEVNPGHVEPPLLCCKMLSIISGVSVWKQLGCHDGNAAISGSVSWTDRNTLTYYPQISCKWVVSGRNLSWSYSLV